MSSRSWGFKSPSGQEFAISSSAENSRASPMKEKRLSRFSTSDFFVNYIFKFLDTLIAIKKIRNLNGEASVRRICSRLLKKKCLCFQKQGFNYSVNFSKRRKSSTTATLSRPKVKSIIESKLDSIFRGIFRRFFALHFRNNGLLFFCGCAVGTRGSNPHTRLAVAK